MRITLTPHGVDSFFRLPPLPASVPPRTLSPIPGWLAAYPILWASRQLSNVNYEQRDNFQMEIAAVEQANRREQDDFENQVHQGGGCAGEAWASPPVMVTTAFNR